MHLIEAEQDDTCIRTSGVTDCNWSMVQGEPYPHTPFPVHLNQIAGSDEGSPVFSASPEATSGTAEADWAATPLAAPPAGEETDSPADGSGEDQIPQ